MIAVDSSALVAILEAEPDAAVFAAAIERADRLLVSAVTPTRPRSCYGPVAGRTPSHGSGGFSASRTIS